MNKKGFTLVEILVSIGLLALLGSVIAISLNRVFKDNNIKNYNEYVEKIKSSAMLYVNNTVDIINDLNDSSFKIITIGNLIDNGYLKDNIINPDMGKTPDKNDKIKVTYDSDHELIVEYPYNDENKEKYLYTLNYTTTYGDEKTKDLCYVGLDTPSLQLINSDGSKVNGTLVKDKSIKAYLESGEECTDSNLSSLKLGTYKIKYNYTDDFTDIEKSENIKSAERTITVKPSKPIINKFEVIKDKNDIYNPTITYNVTDSSKKTDMELKYCINTTGKINDCSSWIEAKNSQDISLKINLNDLDKNISGKNKVDIYLFVKNGFEEYTYKSQNYKISLTVKIELNGGKYNNSTNDLTFNNVDYNKKISDIVRWSSFKKVPTYKFKFEGLKDSNENEYNANSVITEDLTLTAQWYEWCSSKTLQSTSCSKTCGTGNVVNNYVDGKYPNHSCKEVTDQTCKLKDCSCDGESKDCGYFSEDRIYVGTYVCRDTGETLTYAHIRICKIEKTCEDGSSIVTWKRATRSDTSLFTYCCYNSSCNTSGTVPSDWAR